MTGIGIGTADLWGGQLESVQFDVLSHRVTLSIYVIDSDLPEDEQLTTHQLTFHEVSEFRFFDLDGKPWYRAEVSEIHLEKADGRCQAEIWLLTDDNQFRVTCASITVNGIEQ
ncbi:hypothetical protein CLV63_1321 [Murinocardiopsis flavida]|uniref:Immunity protein 50 of polymorphic toxin system n=1 Tax=Murinocardiopsis flavida TaxID=645275 RepID=A0A2P8CQW9_9ACTN|nr:hypothetical protein [Murinocardiopsis flavida]PSK87346.1 hypothetical protein CLV63_1321 [Murinocardiopsis flavida]